MSKLNKLYHHEILDRCHITLCTIEDHLITHPAVDRKMKKKLRKAAALIGEVYQLAGSKY